jgi:DNA primase
MIDDAKIKEIIDKTDIVALVSEYISLTKAGSDYKGICPFHQEKTPSFMVSPSKKIAKCMGCGSGGNPISFLMKIKNINFEEACIILAEKANVELNIKKKNTGPDLSKYYKIMSEAAKFYHYNLISTKSGQEAIKYLEKRGITKEIIEEFNIGLAPDKSDALYLTLRDLKFNEIDMIDCGLVKASDKSDSFYDLFRKRIMFPVCDRNSNIIAFSGRIYNGEEDTAKYINSPETIIFKKNKSIYHIDLAQPHILKKKRVILHEGQMDVIA